MHKTFKSLFVLISISIQLACSTHKLSEKTTLQPKAFAVSSSEPLVSDVAANIFKAGGNIIDATVAASFAISVVRPQSTGIGGGGFLLFYNAKTRKTSALDFREVAPLAARKNMYLKNGEVVPNLSTLGALSVAVPGLVAGLYDLHREKGKLSWAAVVAPSIELAKSRMKVSPHMARALESEKEDLENDSELKAQFFKDHRPLREDEFFTQTNLAKTLEGISKDGKNYFYRGKFAAALSEWMKKNGGIISRADLNAYEVKRRKPIQESWRDYSLVSFPPPSSGGIHLIQILKIFDKISMPFMMTLGKKAAEVESMKRAFADRAYWLGDPDFTIVPQKALLDSKYIAKRAKEISESKVLPSAEILPWSKEKLNHETTHISLMDGEGNAVSTTQSINGYFGAKVSVAGVILNNTMDDFSIKPGTANQFGLVGGSRNSIQPSKRPLSSMTPTLVLNKKGDVELVAGAPGGSRIITGVYYVVSRILRDQESPDEAVSGCRFHHQWMPDKVLVEAACAKALSRELKGYTVEVPPSPFGEVQIVGIDKELQLYSTVDPRGWGKPVSNP